ncbi:YjzC family protein [Bacillaceae bacterium IKA-2]|nr:YjzC family protein [Bacillaceae bacterium IKA-2]
MGQNRQFDHGQKAPNNGIYVEIGETGDMVQNPKSVKLSVGDTFPETSNHNRKWTYKSKFGR